MIGCCMLTITGFGFIGLIHGIFGVVFGVEGILVIEKTD